MSIFPLQNPDRRIFSEGVGFGISHKDVNAKILDSFVKDSSFMLAAIEIKTSNNVTKISEFGSLADMAELWWCCYGHYSLANDLGLNSDADQASFSPGKTFSSNERLAFVIVSMQEAALNIVAEMGGEDNMSSANERVFCPDPVKNADSDWQEYSENLCMDFSLLYIYSATSNKVRCFFLSSDVDYECLVREILPEMSEDEESSAAFAMAFAGAFDRSAAAAKAA